MMEEIWRDVIGYEELYEVSNLGQVRTKEKIRWNSKCFAFRKVRYLTIKEHPSGYIYAALSKDKKQRRYLVHRLVADAFIPNTNNKPFVNHMDGNKLNNVLSNLEWVTRSENAIHAFKIGLQCNKGEKHPKHKATEKIVLEIRAKFQPRKYSSRRLATEYGLSKTNVLDIVNKRIWNHI